MNSKITITANGEGIETEKDILLSDFLKSLGKEPARVVVELNGAALAPSEMRFTRLKGGDRMEIVRIVAGG
jgi:sulfur carrier protein